ncbi:hypothetical protein [Cellulomonas dongxiuzhuiae]|uniref:Secreted protein n=1 Tax=Cellulomonas dongxiuzhuiae TaxID=2819979 RepID=A0ABX8GKG5_9CELL|nr:hypothetical protein [Cellulomonas dongxiuzhuiae]MBO3095636.1 hypothetical protein [Cellulomonas dongxiuzhuiae]QWC16599.1 hypothetical protein KKR89_02735 [Cellulomonas dongxiuzhuiae]
MPTSVHAPRRALLAFLALVLSLFGVAALSVSTAQPAHALCATPPLMGDWHNIDPGTRSVRQVTVGFHCGDQVLCDTDGNCTGGESYFTLRGYGACTPTACDWGSRRAQDMGDGWLRATYTYSWATKYLWVKTYGYYGSTYLRIYTWTDFTAADGRADYATDEWALK